MASPRRIGTPEAKNRGVLIDAAEQLLLAEGRAAVTSRRVAERASLKPQLVHYYFRSMDELFLEILRRRSEQALAEHEQMLRSSTPLSALWKFSIDPNVARIMMEFVGLANQRPEIRAEVACFAEQFRTIQTEALTRILNEYGVDTERFQPAAVAVLMTSISRVVVLEQAMGMSSGHSEAFELVEKEIHKLEPSPTDTDERP